MPVDLPVHPDALGFRHRLRVGGVLLDLALPVVAEHPAPGDALEAPMHPYLSRPLPAVLQGACVGDWGSLSGSQVAYVRTLGLSVLLPADAHRLGESEVLPELGRAFGVWLEVVRQWASVCVDVPLLGGDEHARSIVHLAYGKGLVGSGAHITGGHRGAGPVLFLRKGLTPEQVCRAFGEAAQAQGPPLPLVLLLTAQRARWSGDYWQAVIDSATAVEVALADEIRKLLTSRGVPLQFAELAVNQANGVVGLARLYEGLGPTSPVSANKLMNELAAPRNQAAHAGVTPSEAVAARVHGHARAMVLAFAGAVGKLEVFEGNRARAVRP